MTFSPQSSAETPRPLNATEALRELRAYLGNKSTSVDELNAEQDETLAEIDRDRMQTATEAIEKRKMLSMELAA